MARRMVESTIQQGKDILGKKPVSHFASVHLWKDVKTQEQRQGVFSLRFNVEGNALAIGYGNGAIDMIDVSSGKMIKNLRRARYGGFQVMCMQFCPTQTSNLFVSTSEGNVIVCDTNTSDCKNIVSEENNEINCFDFSCDSYMFATAGKDLGVRVYDTKTYKLVNNWEGNTVMGTSVTSKRNSMRVFALRYHPIKEDMFITGGWDNQLKIWDTRTRDGVQRTISGPHICGDSIDVRGNEILTGSWVGTKALQLWDYVDGTLVNTIPFPHDDEGQFLYCAQFGDENAVLAGGSGTNSVEVMDSKSGRHIGGVKMKKPVQAMDSTFGGRLFALGGQDPVVKIATIH